MMRLLFRICTGLLTLGVLALLCGAVGLGVLLLLPVAIVLGGGVLAVFAVACLLLLIL